VRQSSRRPPASGTPGPGRAFWRSLIPRVLAFRPDPMQPDRVGDNRDKAMVQPYRIRPLITSDQIAARVDALAAEINTHFAGTERLVVVGLLRGSFVFIADLVRLIELPVEVDFIEASSYGSGTESSREVRILKDLRSPVEGRDVLVVEDIVDTGHTLKHVLRLLATHRPARLEVCALLSKPSRREVEIRARWIGFEIPDEFVVGYGIDYAQRNRNLPYIGTVAFD
jgi:hypoxanthine phosphoribosyltransferase